MDDCDAPRTVPELIDRLGGPAKYSRAIGKGPSTGSEQKRTGSIPPRYWEAVIAAAADAGIPGVTADSLVRMHAAESVRPTHKREGAAA